MKTVKYMATEMNEKRSIYLNSFSGVMFLFVIVWKQNFFKANKIPYSKIAIRIGACIPSNHNSTELNPRLGGALMEL